MNTERIKIISGYILICLIWGSTWMVIRIGLDSLTPLISAGFRFFIASMIILLIIKVRGLVIQADKRSIKLYFFLGFMSFVIPFWLVYWAEQYISSGLASILFGTFPFSVFLFSLLLLDDKQTDKYKLFSIILGFVGIVIIYSDGLTFDLDNHFLGISAAILSALLQGLVAVVIKKWGGHLNPFSMNAPPLFIAGLSMIGLAFLFEDSRSWNFDSKAIFSILYLAIFGTILAFTTYFWLLKRINAVLLSLSSFITPIIAIILGWLFLSEKLSMQILAGSIFVLVGILFGNFNAIINLIQKRRSII